MTQINSQTIHFLGFSSSDNTWEPEHHLVNCKDMVQVFHDERAKRKRSEYSYSDSDSDSVQSRRRRRTIHSSIPTQFSTDNSSVTDDDGYIARKSTSKRSRESTSDSESTSSTDSYDSDILDMAKLHQIVDVRRNKDTYQVEYNVRLKRIKKSVWVSSRRLIEQYAEEVVDFLEEEFV